MTPNVTYRMLSPEGKERVQTLYGVTDTRELGSFVLFEIDDGTRVLVRTDLITVIELRGMLR